MADEERRGLGRPAIIAIGFAVVALLTSLAAVFVVAGRGGTPATVVAPVKSAVIEKTIDAGDVTKLKRDVVEKVTDDHGTLLGVKLKDESLRAALGLEPGDIITAIGGRTIKREFDVYDAVLGMSMMDASIVYVDLLREKQPTLVRWRLDGDLRSARRDPIRPRPSPTNPFLNPGTANDPLVDTIRKVDDLTYEVPRTTIDLILANPDFYARQARVVPSIHQGVNDGFKLYAIQPGSLWAGIGVQNGDTLHAANNNAFTSPDKALEIFQKIRDANEIKLEVIRRSGTQETITIAVK